MDAYGVDVRMTPAARGMLRPGEALVLVLLCKALKDFHILEDPFTVVRQLEDHHTL